MSTLFCALASIAIAYMVLDLALTLTVFIACRRNPGLRGRLANALLEVIGR